MHKLRRSVATIIAASRGISAASELLGHSNSEITRRYVDPSKLPGKDATQFLPLLTSPPPEPEAEPAKATPVEREEGKPAEREAWLPLDFLTEAHQLAESGHFSASAMTARIALERAIKKRFSQRIGKKSKGDSLSDLIYRLTLVGEFSREEASRLKKVIAKANRTAHSGLIDAEGVAEVLECADLLIDRGRAA
jgi:HEPN domain-containing protein